MSRTARSGTAVALGSPDRRRRPQPDTGSARAQQRAAQLARRRALRRRGQDGRRPESAGSRLVLGLAVTAVAALVVGVALVTGFLDPPAAPAGPTPVAAAQVVVHGTASGIGFSGATGWVTDDTAGTVRRFDPGSGRTSRPVHVGGVPVAVAAGGHRVWVADSSGNQVEEVDAATLRVAGAPVAVGQGPVSVAVGAGGVWVAALQDGTVSLVDPSTAQVEATVALPDGAVRLAVGDGAVWVTGKTDTLTRIDPKPHGVSLRWTSTTVGRGPLGVAVGPGAVWVANGQSGTVSRVDPKTLRVTGTFPVPGPGSTATPSGGPDAIAVFDGRVWVSDYGQAAVVALDARSGRPVGTAAALPGPVRQLVVGDGALWAATANPGAVVRIDPR